MKTDILGYSYLEYYFTHAQHYFVHDIPTTLFASSFNKPDIIPNCLWSNFMLDKVMLITVKQQEKQ